MNSTSMPTSCTIVFSSKSKLEEALKPFTSDQYRELINTSTASVKLHLQVNEELNEEKILPLRNPGIKNLKKTELFKTKFLTVFYPEDPRVPHHLTIVLNRKEIRGIGSITQEENAELFTTLKKIAEIYKTLSIGGFVVAQYDTPQEGHFDHFVVEIIPHLPGFKDVKNMVDKMVCYRDLLFRSANLTPIEPKLIENNRMEKVELWKMAFEKGQLPLNEQDTRLHFPLSRKETIQLETDKFLFYQVAEIFQNRGGSVVGAFPPKPTLPIEVPKDLTSVEVKECVFCKKNVIDNQLIFEDEHAYVFYNIRQGGMAESCFLLLPKRHVEKIYELTTQEIYAIWLIRKGLVALIKEAHPGWEVIDFIQDEHSVGQTVPHSHEHIIGIDPKTADLVWGTMFLFPSKNASQEDMLKMREGIGSKLAHYMKYVSEENKSVANF